MFIQLTDPKNRIFNFPGDSSSIRVIFEAISYEEFFKKGITVSSAMMSFQGKHVSSVIVSRKTRAEFYFGGVTCESKWSWVTSLKDIHLTSCSTGTVEGKSF